MLLLLAMNDILRTVKNTISDFDVELWKHCLRTAKLSTRVGDILGVDKDLLFQAGLVHDIGKIFVKPDIIFNVGLLSEEDRKEIDKHSVMGYVYLKSLGFTEDLCQIVLLHHGSHKETYGYDYNESNVMYADIVRACDIYDALTHKRCYHSEVSMEKAMGIVESQIEKIPNYIVDALKKVQVVF